MLIIHELSQRMPERMLSLSILIVAKYPLAKTPSQPSQVRSKAWLPKVPVWSKNITFDPNAIQGRGFGLKLGPTETCSLSRPFRTSSEANNKPRITKTALTPLP